MTTEYGFCVAEHVFKIDFTDSRQDNIHLLPSFIPFIKEGENGGYIFYVKVREELCLNLPPLTDIHNYSTPNGSLTVETNKKDAYRITSYDDSGNCCAIMQTMNGFKNVECVLKGTRDMRAFGLNNSIMMVFTFRTSAAETLLIHASAVIHKGYGYAFIARSGTGKSTHTRLWTEHIADTELLNDDNPIVRIIDNQVFIYGSPWSGKTPCYRNIKAKLGAITQVIRDERNYAEVVSPVRMFCFLQTACSTLRMDNKIYHNTNNTIARLIELIRNHSYALHCRPDKEAAVECHKTICRNDH